jgi:hypothetical protein
VTVRNPRTDRLAPSYFRSWHALTVPPLGSNFGRSWGHSGRRLVIVVAPSFGRSRPIARRSRPRDGAALAGSRHLRHSGCGRCRGTVQLRLNTEPLERLPTELMIGSKAGARWKSAMARVVIAVWRESNEVCRERVQNACDLVSILARVVVIRCLRR